MSSEEADDGDSILEINIPNPQARAQEYSDFLGKGSRIHASFLFYRDGIRTDAIPQTCLKIFTTLVQRIGGTKESYTTSGWKDFGYHLGIKGEELNYIENSVKNCPTETVLRVFCQDEDATFEKIIKALLAMKRLDTIEGMFDGLRTLTNDLIEKFDGETDQGYYSNKSKLEEDVLKPSCFLNNLPEVLRRHKKKDIESNFNDTQDSDMPVVTEPSILVTYFEDGLAIAHKIYDSLNNRTVNGRNIKVILLDNERSNVLINPEHYIRHYFEKVNYVIPVLSDGYFRVVKSTSSLCPSGLDNVDVTYARFVYTLMSSHYINGTGCLNRKVRGVLPRNGDRAILKDLYKYPILSVWIREDEMGKLAGMLFPSG